MAEEVIILEAPSSTEESFAPMQDETVLEESTAQALENETIQELQKSQKKKKHLLIGGLLGLLLLIIIAFIAVLLLKESAPKESPKLQEPEEVKAPLRSQFSPSKLEGMIKKANLLYEQGNKEDALKIYENIATFNEAISYYNIGVAKMKEQNFQEALEAFKKAIHNKEHRCISAINAAVCALEIKDSKLFEYYIDLAFAYLPEESNAPLYSYYVALVHYYKNFYYEALSAMSHPNSAFYREDQKYLSSKILTSLDYNDHARKSLLEIEKESDIFTLGLLHAKQGDFPKAKNALMRALKQEPENIKIKMALSLIENKLGNLANSASLLSEVSKVIPPESKPPYRLRSLLRPSLFDVQKAQHEFEKELFFNNETIYSTIFYYAPYKVFDAKQTID